MGVSNTVCRRFLGVELGKDIMAVPQSLQGRDVIIELHPVGSFIKISAMDVQSLTEISVQGPAKAPEEILKRNALKRLEYVLRKKGLIS